MAEITEAQREQIKLRANYINGLAIGTFTAGALSPIIALTLHEGPTNQSLPLASFVACLCFVASFVLHLKAVEQLSEL
ncbi:hypothetical protein ACVCNR_11170 [Aquamicrobium terrae]